MYSKTKAERRSSGIPGRPIRVSPEKEAEIISAFNLDLLHSWQGKQPRTELALQAVKAYRAFLEAKTNSIFFTNLYIPVVFSAIETAVAAEWKALFPPQFLEFIPRDATNQQDCEQAAYYNDCFDYHWNKLPQILKLTDLLRQRHLFGSCFAIHFWKEEERRIAAWGDSEVRTYEPTGETDEFGNEIFNEYVDTGRTIVPQMKKTVDSPCWDVIHFLEAFPDWEVNPSEFQNSRYFIHLKPRSKVYIEKRFKSKAWKHRDYKEICDSAGFDGGSLGGGETSDSVKSWQQLLGLTYDNSSETSQGGMHEVAEYYRPEGVYTIVDRRWVTLARDGYPMGRIPVSYIPNHPDPAGGFYGISSFELIKSPNNHIQNMANASGTEAILSVFPIMEAPPSVDKSQLRVRPGHVITSPQPGSVSFIQRPTVGIQIADQQKQAMLSTIDDTLGTSEVVRGSLPTRDTSATAVAQSVSSSGRRMELNTGIVGECFIKPLGEAYRDMINLMQTEEISAQMRDSAKTRVITPEQLQDPDLDCRPVMNSANLKELEKKQLMEFLTVCSQLGIQSIDLDAAARIYAQQAIPKFAAEIIRTPEEAEIMRQAQQLEMQTQGAAGPESTGAAPPSNRNYENMEGDHAAASRGQASAMSV